MNTMSNVYPLLVSEIHRLHNQLVDCQPQLQHLAAHPEALHQLRVCLRQLRSLLRPFHRYSQVEMLDLLLAKVIKQSNTIRDEEVLVAELQLKQHTVLYDQHYAHLQMLYIHFAMQTSTELIIQRLITLPLYWQYNLALLADKKLNKQITSHCLSQHKKLKNRLKNKMKLDKHRLRLGVKKLRYALESYGQLLSIKPNFIKRLKKTQDILGNWHDRWVWLEKAKHEDALQELVPIWQNELQYYERLAEMKLGRLLKHLKVS